MFVLILTFAISLSLIAAVLGYKIVRIRQGAVEVTENHQSGLSSIIPYEFDFVALRNFLIAQSKKYGHKLVLLALKLWIKMVFFVRRKKEIYAPKIKAFINKNKPQELKSPEASKFLRSVSAYKNRLKHISKKIKEKEEEKVENLENN